MEMESFIYVYYTLLLGKSWFEIAPLFFSKEYEGVKEIIRANVEKKIMMRCSSSFCIYLSFPLGF